MYLNFDYFTVDNGSTYRELTNKYYVLIFKLFNYERQPINMILLCIFRMDDILDDIRLNGHMSLNFDFCTTTILSK